MDDNDPVYVARDGHDAMHSAINIADSVIVIQNKAVEYPNGYTCNNRPVLANLRNPLGPALSAVAGAVLGLSGVEPDADLPDTAHHHDRASIACGGSPFFRGLASLHPQYSDFDVVSRADVLHVCCRTFLSFDCDASNADRDTEASLSLRIIMTFQWISAPVLWYICGAC